MEHNRALAKLGDEALIADGAMKGKVATAMAGVEASARIAEGDAEQRRQATAEDRAADKESKSAEPKSGNGKDKAPIVHVHTGGGKKIDIVRDGEGKITGADVTDGD